MSDMPRKYAADEGSGCEFCGKDAVYKIGEVNVCADSVCKMRAFTSAEIGDEQQSEKKP